MRAKLPLRQGAWTVADQLVVSGGTFLVNLLLARHLPPAEYGLFAMVLGGMLTLQLFSGSLLLYPLSVRLQAMEGEAERTALVRSTLVLVALFGAAIALPLAVVLALFGYAELILPASLCCVLWQVQEGTRRCLLATFRHQAAIPGDAASYAGQALVVLALVWGDGLSLSGAYVGMAATALVAASIQWGQLGLPIVGPLPLRRVVAESWAFGGGWSLVNGFLSQLRGLVLIWSVAIQGGIGAAAALQAVLNVVNMANPLLFSLANIIPQAAAKARRHGNAEAWRAARSYAVLAMPLFLGYGALILAAPGLILLLLYGSSSEYAGLGNVLRLFVLGALLGYAADIVISFLHGVVALRLATLINAAGLLATLVLAWPLVGQFGLAGGCMMTIAANLVRLAACRMALAKVVGSLDPHLPARAAVPSGRSP